VVDSRIWGALGAALGSRFVVHTAPILGTTIDARGRAAACLGLDEIVASVTRDRHFVVLDHRARRFDTAVRNGWVGLACGNARGCHLVVHSPSAAVNAGGESVGRVVDCIAIIARNLYCVAHQNVVHRRSLPVVDCWVGRAPADARDLTFGLVNTIALAVILARD
jgi:hypothetical protein